MKLSLTFEPSSLEEKYIQHHTESAIKRIRYGFLLAIFLFSAFLVVDLLNFGLEVSTQVVFRGLVDLISIGLYYLSFKPFFARHYNKIVSSYSTFLALVLWYFVTISPVDAQLLYPMGFMILIGWLFFLSGLLFADAVIQSVITVFIYVAMWLISFEFDSVLFTASMFYIVAGAIVSGFNGYIIERISRKNYEALLNEQMANGEIEDLYQQIQQEANDKMILNEDLIQKKEHLDMAMAASKIAFWEIDVRENVYTSNNIVSMLGHHRIKMPFDVDAFMRLIHPEDRSAVEAARLDYHKGMTEEYNVTFRMKTHNNEWRYVQEKGQFSRFDGDDPIRLSGVHIDVHKRMMLENDLKSALNRVVTLYDASMSMSSFYDRESIMDVISQKMGHVIQYDTLTIQEMKGQYLSVIHQYGFDRILIENLVFGIRDNKVIWQSLQSKEGAIVKDTRYMNEFYDATANDKIRSCMVLPLIHRDEVLGVMTVDSYELNKFTSQDLDIAYAFAAQIAIALKNARLIEELNEAKQKQEAYNDELTEQNKELLLRHTLIKELNSNHDMVVGLKAISAAVVDYFDCHCSTIMLNDNTKSQLGLFIENHENEFDNNTIGYISKASRMFTRVTEKGKSVVLQLPKDAYFFGQAADRLMKKAIKTVIAVPIRRRNELQGILFIGSEEEQTYTDYDLSILNTVSYQLGSYIESYQLRAQEDMAQKEMFKLSKAIEFSPVSVEITSPEGLIEYVNPKGMAMLGQDISEILGEECGLFSSLNHEAAYYENVWDAIHSGQAWYDEFMSVNKYGEYVWDKASISPILNQQNKVEHLVIIREDITERKMLEEELKQSLKQAESLYETSLVLRSTQNIEEILFDVLSQLKKLSDYDQATVQIYEKNAFKVIYTSGSDTTCYGEVYDVIEGSLEEEIIKERKPLILNPSIANTYTGSHRLSTENEAFMIVPLVYNDEMIGALTLSKGEPNYYQSKDAQLCNAFATQAAIALKNARFFEDISRAKEEAEAATQLKSEFLAIMSHEIRTPMNAITGMCHLILNTSMTSKQYDYISKINNASQNLTKIINDILDFSKIEAGKLDIETTEFDLSDVLVDVISVVSLRAAEKELELIVDVEDNMPEKLLGDPLRLSQVIINLTNNAVKFTSEGFIKLDLNIVSEDEESVRIAFSVIDTGIGIANGKVEELFESFTQEDKSTTRKFGGTGLGLTISKTLIDSMGGNIDVVSEVGIGSHFVFEIPFEKQMYKSIEPPIRMEHLDINQCKILIIDDNKASLDVVKHYLEEIHMKVDVALSGMEGVDLIRAANKRKNGYDLIIVDWKMPIMDGFETISVIRSLFNKRKHVPKILLSTSFSSVEILKKTGFHESDGTLFKPVIRRELYKKVVNTLDKDYQEEDLIQIELDQHPNLEGIRCLLVEDNDVNAQIVLEIMAYERMKVQWFENGQEIVDYIMEQEDVEDIDLIFMDLQMPIMDGYEACKQIREIYDADELPIVAMTADAIKGVEEKVAQAGMNGYISKPIVVDNLLSTIERLTKNKQKSNLNQVKMSILPFDQLYGIDVEEGMIQHKNDSQAYLEHLEIFYNQYANCCDDMHGLIYYDQFEEALHMLEEVNAVAQVLGMNSIVLQTNTLILEAKSSHILDVHDFESLENEMYQICNSLFEMLKRMTKKNRAYLKPKGDGRKLLEGLNQLLGFLEQSNQSAAKKLFSWMDQYDWSSRYEETLKVIRKHLYKDHLKMAKSNTEDLIGIIKKKYYH